MDIRKSAITDQADRVTISLVQAVRWAALGYEPLEQRLEQIRGYPKVWLVGTFTDIKYEAAARMLVEHLAEGSINASGHKFIVNQNDLSIKTDDCTVILQKLDQEVLMRDLPFADGREIVPPHVWHWEQINWADSCAWHVRRGDGLVEIYGDIELKIEQIKPMETQSISTQFISQPENESRSPYINFLVTAAAELSVEEIAEWKKHDLVEWVRNRSKEFLGWELQDSKCRMAATFLRFPEQERGGAKRQARSE